MSRNGSGTYVLPSGNPVTTGTTITSAWANTTLSDIASALTGSVANDGQTTMIGNLNMGTYQVKNMAEPTVSTDATTKNYVDNVSSTLTAAITAAIAAALPTGIISMWKGSVATIPTGWYLCDGTNGTPDLRDKFIVGAGSTYAVAATGGSKDAIVVSHTHTATSTVTDPGHNHSLRVTRLGPGGSGGGGANVDFPTDSYLTSTSTTGVTVATSIASAGSSGTNANLPPYYALAYIMKA